MYMKKFVQSFTKALLIFPLFLMIHIEIIVYLDIIFAKKPSFVSATLKLFIAILLISMFIILVMYMSTDMRKKTKNPKMMAAFDVILTILFLALNKYEIVQNCIIFMVVLLDLYLSFIIAINFHSLIHKMKNVEDKHIESYTLDNCTFTFEHTEKTYPVFIPILVAIITGSCAIIAALLK